MEEKSTETGTESRPVWESLEALARQGVQRLLQQLLEEEVEEVFGRHRYERRDEVDARPGYRNGYGKPRGLSAMTGTITIRRPRVRGLEARFESRLLPLFKRRTEEVGRLLPELYLHGLAHGDFDLGLRGLLGAAAPLSAPSIARLKAGWQVEYEMSNHRLVNVLATLPKKLHAEARALLTKIPYAPTRAEAGRLKCGFQTWATKKAVAVAGHRLDEDWERLETFYAFPKEHWKHLRITNVMESPFAAVRLRTAAAKRFKKLENATAVI